MKTMKFSYGIKLLKPKYIILQIIADKGIRNYKNIDIARAINKTYKSIDKRIKIEQRKLIIETSFKISYAIDISKLGVQFYFVVPEVFKDVLINQISNVWHKAEIKEADQFTLPKDYDIYQLYYKNEDALSLKVDRKSNEPLNSILNVINIMEKEDRITLFYNFIPNPNQGFKYYYDEIMERYKNNELLEKQDYSIKTIVKRVALGTTSILQSIIDVLNDFLGNVNTDERNEKNNLYKMMFNILNEKKQLSNNTRNKKESIILDTQIALISSSNSDDRRYKNSQVILNSFGQLEEDNSFKMKKVNKRHFDMFKTNIGTTINKCSVEESNNFIQLPAKTLINEYKINHIEHNEIKVGSELTSGNKIIGEITFKGQRETAFLPNDYNVGNLPLYLLGGQNAGKTTVLKRYAKDCIECGEGVVCIDYIKNCELASAIESITPKDKLVKIDLSSDHMQSFAYNEYKFDKKDVRKAIKRVKQQALQIETLINSINVNDELSPRMSRYLNSGAVLSILNGMNSLKDTINIFTNYKLREQVIASVREQYKDIDRYIGVEIQTLEELDEYSKPNKDNSISEKIGNKDSKIDFILDRVNSLRKDFSLQELYENDSFNNIDLVECMEQGKVVLILMNESDFNTEQVKNVVVTYYISKLWVASQMRGVIHETPLRCNIILDEIFQAPTCLSTLQYIIPQSRKFGTKFVMSGHYLSQIKGLAETLISCGTSYRLGYGVNEKDFVTLSRFINTDEWTFDDIKDIKQWYFFNIIKTKGGYESFISLPISINV